MDVLYGLTKDFVFKEAVAFLKGKRSLSSISLERKSSSHP